MSDSTISQLPVASSVSMTDLVAVDQGAVTSKATVAQLQGAIGTAQIASDTHLAASKTTPVDADELPLVDSASSFTLKKLTWANLKATLVSYLSALTSTWAISTIGNAATATNATNATNATTAASCTGNSATATALQTPRTIDGISFDGTANIVVVAPAIHASPSKATPVDADELGIWDSVSLVLNKVTWANIKATLVTYLSTLYAALAGSASQVFSVGDATSADHAAKLKQVSLFPTVTSSASPDIFGAAGATINYDNSTPVTATSFAACTTAQIGSKKTIIPTANANFTASSSLIIDGQTSGTYIMPKDAIVEAIALTTTSFKVITIFATGTWTPTISQTGLTIGQTTFGSFVKIGRQVTSTCDIAITSLSGTPSGNVNISGFPLGITIGGNVAFRENSVAGFVWAATRGGSDNVNIYRYDNTNVLVNGMTFNFVLTYFG